MSATEHLLLFGKIGKPDDVVSVRFDEVAGTLTPLDSVKVGLSPDYIERHPKHSDLVSSFSTAPRPV
ncbi:hypothetical protein EHS25_003677 [Saitozyma podzolica]|uniref:Uncharacterized protein n=1 Tax=Saitozyma podzolica TaxID=1890683 RepID=A0A427Y7X8_9TREE|nr:hypothetical protein EHS25_003677 [Saitozyma podzolica]